MKITREIKTAILVIASILLFIWGYSFLRGSDLLSDYRTFYVEFDNVEGLAPSAPVTISGLAVGKVTAITLHHETAKLTVEIQIKSDFPISKSSVVNLYEPGFIGGKQLQIIPNLEDQTPAESGDKLKSGIVPGLLTGLGDKLAPVQQKVELVLVSADSLISNLNDVLDTKTKNNLKASIENLNATMASFSKTSKSLSEIMDHNKGKIDGVVTNFEKISSNFSKVSDTIAKAKIGEAINNLEKTLDGVNKIVKDLETGKGTMGKLLKDDAMYNNFTKTSKELELLLQDLRLNPTRYINVSVFGKKNKPYVAPKVTDTIK
ncbi:phospholipid/cholesterol/gamma-HCH transport system substrate-binding protein [Flavobacterium arsenatis]|uniref:Phospholipid/cholesterol/gamma-HCH transport system substrate-binding protein n=1 Tax=Flavobacterium arsenatis TaxID=1484332 RepID=A0ABU1TME8_9FLAO|nr:MlaD family protein [Flavobacterium arsenatis]MDR6967141.1 phospholipid/cholesterol/gamma-HCH transport system substrate-binding protein [Flavobacterium arsenatis]